MQIDKLKDLILYQSENGNVKKEKELNKDATTEKISVVQKEIKNF